MTSPLSQNESRITITEDEAGQVNIYPRSNGGRYYCEIRIKGYGKKRLSTGTSDEHEATTIALQKYIEANVASALA